MLRVNDKTQKLHTQKLIFFLTSNECRCQFCIFFIFIFKCLFSTILSKSYVFREIVKFIQFGK
jgi:hypothetical protein